MSKVQTLTKASRTSRPCSTLRGVATLSPRVIRVRVVKHTMTSLGSTWWSIGRKRKIQTASSSSWELSIWFMLVNYSPPWGKQLWPDQVIWRQHRRPSCRMCELMETGENIESKIKLPMSNSHWRRQPLINKLALKSQVAHVQDGGQQLGDLPGLCLGEHEHLHRCQDAGVVVQVITTVALGAVTLRDWWFFSSMYRNVDWGM